MNRNKKNLHKVAANVLGVTLASALVTGAVAETAAPIPVFAAQQEAQTQEKIIYLNGSIQAGENADGTGQAQAVDSFEKAFALAGGQGTVMVCGTVNVSTEKKLHIPAGVKIKRNAGFTGALVKVTGKGNLTVTGDGITAQDVDVLTAESGKGAFVAAKIPQVVMPAQITLNNLAEWNTCSFPLLGFTGEGAFTWGTQVPPSSYETEMKVVFTPKDTENYDYSQVSGWDNQSKTVTRTIKVFIEALKPQVEEPAKPMAEVQIPSELKFATKEEFKNLDFANAGFKGEGVFAWEAQTEPSSYETKMNVVFTPSDIEKYDYTQTAGWNGESKKIVREVKVFIEELKENTTEPETPQPEVPETEVPETEKPETETPETTPPTEPENPDTQEPEVPQTEAPEAEVPETEKPENGGVEIEYVNPDEVVQPEEETQPEVTYQAEAGQNGEIAQEAPEALPVGSLIDETGVQVSGDFIPYYVDLQVTYNEAVNELPDAGIGEILSAYELKLWDLKEDKEYQIPEGRKVKVLIPLPENANCFSDLSIAHYLGNNRYEYFVFSKDGKTGNMTVEEKDGAEYLAFETASFSPFNVGGHQIVGPGVNSDNHKPSTGTSQSTTQTKPNTSASNSSAQSTVKPNTQKKPAQNNTTPVVQIVKTGDESKTVLYVLIGFGALIIVGLAVFFGKKKK